MFSSRFTPSLSLSHYTKEDKKKEEEKKEKIDL